MVLTAPTGEEGLRLAAAQRPAAIVVDGVLPGIDGATVIRRMRLDAALRDVPCLLLTARKTVARNCARSTPGPTRSSARRITSTSSWPRSRRCCGGRRPRAARRDAGACSAPKKILAVDDSPTYLDELADALRERGTSHAGAVR